MADYLRETADLWNDNLENWTYVVGTELAQRMGVEGYYVRIAPLEVSAASSPKDGFVAIKNRPPEKELAPATSIVSPDALALVRFGLRDANDARILNTVKVIDALLKVETPAGPAWHRYDNDGYGEHKDGAPFDGTGIGRAWPLLTGERAHYELAAGRPDEAKRLCRALEAFSSATGLIPEQIWDSSDIPERGLFLGRPSGSAMPLVWAHAEYLKLCRSLVQGSIYDMPHQTKERYQKQEKHSPFAVWRFNNKSRLIPAGKILRLEVLAPAMVRWSPNGWKTIHDVETRDVGLGMHVVDLETGDLRPGAEISFTFRWHEDARWEGENFSVEVQDKA
jgi:glucoamylase